MHYSRFAFSQRSHRPMAEINLVPFIDVMLVLLVIFMITTPLLTQGVKVELPQTTTQAIPHDARTPLIVTVDAQGQYYLNIASKPHEPITARVLTDLVSTELTTDAQNTDRRPVLVRGDKNANYGQVMAAMEILQHAGAQNVGLVTQPADAGLQQAG